MDRDKLDFDKWLQDKNLTPTRRQKTIWLVIWRASRETLPKEEPKSWLVRLLEMIG